MKTTEQRDKICNECLEEVERMARITRQDASEGAFQKSKTLPIIKERIEKALKELWEGI